MAASDIWFSNSSSSMSDSAAASPGSLSSAPGAPVGGAGRNGVGDGGAAGGAAAAGIPAPVALGAGAISRAAAAPGGRYQRGILVFGAGAATGGPRILGVPLERL